MSKEKRRFKRYRFDHKFDIDIAGRLYHAVAQDYSVDGLNLYIDGGQDIAAGVVINLNIPKISLKGTGKIVRVTRSNGGVRLGVMRMGLLHGQLVDFSVADVLLGLQRGRKTGQLFFKIGSINKTVHFLDGDIVYASSNSAEDWLGEMLVREGKITRNQFNESSVRMKAEKKLHGTVLVEMKLIAPKDLFEAVTRSAENIIISLFKMARGEFMFKEGLLPQSNSLKLKLSAANLIYRGLRQLDDIELVRSMAPAADDVLCASTDPLDLLKHINFLPDDMRLLKMVDCQMTYKELLGLSSMDTFEAMKAYNALLGTRVVELNEDLFAKKSHTASKHWKEEVGGPTLKEDEKVKARNIFDKKPADDKAAKESMINEVETLYGKYQQLGYYGILGVERDAPNSAIKKSYYHMARTFHPDKHFDMPDAVKVKLNTLFTYITQAYSTLTNASRRSEYDKGGKTAHGDNTIIDPAERAKEKFKEAVVLLRIKKYEHASKLLGEATYLDPDVATYHYHAAMSMIGEGKHREAERALQRALKIEPSNAEYLAESGHIYLTLGFELRAKSAFEKALQIDPKNQRAKEGLKP